MEKSIKYKTNNTKFNPYGSVYDVYVGGVKVGYVKKGKAHSGYWGSWESFINGSKHISDSRQNAVEGSLQNRRH